MVRTIVERRVLSNIDWQLGLGTLLLCAMGLGLLFSAGYNPETGTSLPMKRQAFAMGIGSFAFLICMFVHPNFWKRFAYFFYGVGCVLLILVLVSGVVAGGAQRWISLGAFRMQPSEFMKIGIILALARMFSSDWMPRDGFRLVTLLPPAILLFFPVGLVMLEPDLGTGLCLLLIGGSMLLIAGVQSKTFIRLAAVGLLAVFPAWSLLKDYQQRRILTFLSPESDPLGSGYHALQSKIAVGSGAFSGKGFLEGTQTQLSFLPEQTTDFIFSVLAEEWGFVGSMAAIVLYVFLLRRLVKAASRSTERFSAFLAIGVGAMIFWHVVINIGMVIGLLPVVGLTLPLLSYGGSSVVTVMSGLGLVAGARMHRFLFT